MKKRIALFLALVLMFSLFAGCGGDGGDDATDSTAEIALVINTNALGINDRSFSQLGWETVSAFGEANDKTYAYYQPTDTSLESFLAAFELAVNNGAEVIVACGYEFGDSLLEAQNLYPDVSFIAVDVSTLAEVASNTYSVTFNTVEGTFFAGVASVYEGYTHLGSLNTMNITPVNNWLYGYIQGVNWAAGYLGIDDIVLDTYYFGNGDVSPENQAIAASWYENGVELIFANAGGTNASIWAAAEAAGGWTIGCDVDQYAESDTVITSSLKRLDLMVTEALELYYAGEFPGGISEEVGVAEYAVGIAMEHSRMENYTQELYAEHYQMMLDDVDGMYSNLLYLNDVEDINDLASRMTNITVNVIES